MIAKAKHKELKKLKLKAKDKLNDIKQKLHA